MSYREKHLIVQMFFLLAVLTGAVSAQEKLFDWSGIPDLFPASSMSALIPTSRGC